MRILPLSTSCLLLLISTFAAEARQPPQTVETALAGRTAGKPQSCISQTRIDSTEIFDSGSILYRMRGGPDYLNTPKPQCTALQHGRQSITATPSSSLCRGDIMRIADFTSHIPYGSCALGDFVPYPRLKKGQ